MSFRPDDVRHWKFGILLFGVRSLAGPCLGHDTSLVFMLRALACLHATFTVGPSAQSISKTVSTNSIYAAAQIRVGSNLCIKKHPLSIGASWRVVARYYSLSQDDSQNERVSLSGVKTVECILTCSPTVLP